jgi:hypothetical protein
MAGQTASTAVYRGDLDAENAIQQHSDRLADGLGYTFAANNKLMGGAS